jgi:hypothetical protein
MVVVVLLVVSEHPMQVPVPIDQQVVEALAA